MFKLYFFDVKNVLEYKYNIIEGSDIMNIIIFGKNLEVKEGIKTQINDKFAKVGKYLDDDTNVDVTLSERKNMKKVEVTIPVRGHIIRAEEEDMDLFAAIDMAQDTLIRQLIRHKEKLIDSKRTAKEIFEDDYVEEYSYDDEGVQIVRTKRFGIKPMDAEEACEQMDMLGHSFFVFLNADTDEVNVVYKRKGDTYGLIEPELD